MSYNTFCNIHEDVLEWLLDVEDKLKVMNSVGSELSVVKEQYHSNRSFLIEVESQDCSVGEVNHV